MLTSISKLLIQFYGSLQNEERNEPFESFIEKKLSAYVTAIEEIDSDELLKIIEDKDAHFVVPHTKKRFANFIEKLCDECKAIMSYYYSGEINTAINNTIRLFDNKSLFKRYIDCELWVLSRVEFSHIDMYRMVDFEIGETPNCWHVPFDKRQCCWSSRFSLSCIPIMYMSDSIETACKEARPIEKNKVRYYSHFRPKGKHPLLLMDFRLPDNNVDMKAYTIFYYLVYYPIFLVCFSKVNESHSNHEEYIFPQMLMNYIIHQGVFVGLIHSSVQNPKGSNIVLKATPKYNEKFSSYLQQNIEEVEKCIEYKQNK